MKSILTIQAGQYRIGDDSLPQAAPAHLRMITSPVWVSSELVSWAHFEAFVMSGGYTPQLISELSNASVGKVPHSGGFDFSVDRRIEQLLNQPLQLVANWLSNIPAPSVPITGLTWFEAVALTSFLGGRLPYETEWEVTQLSFLMNQPIRFQEWTLDAYAKYWRSDGQRRGQRWTPQASGGISIRGARPNDHIRAIGNRIGDSPWNVETYRGLRVVWDSQPGPA